MGKKGGGRVRVKQVGPKAPVNPLESLAIPPEEMINFPVKPDTNISHVWPLSESFTMEYKHFSVIYPTYLDSDKTVKQGRRIAAKDAVPNPTVVDIGQALQVGNRIGAYGSILSSLSDSQLLLCGAFCRVCFLFMFLSPDIDYEYSTRCPALQRILSRCGVTVG